MSALPLRSWLIALEPCETTGSVYWPTEQRSASMARVSSTPYSYHCRWSSAAPCIQKRPLVCTFTPAAASASVVRR